MMQPRRANVGAAMTAHCTEHAWLYVVEGYVIWSFAVRCFSAPKWDPGLNRT